MATGSTLNLHKVRIEALTDGVFAIMLTLLVLELKVPEMPRAEAELHLGEHLRHLAPVFVSFIVTFIVGGLFWYLHHLSFHFVNHTSPKLVVANLFFLGFVSLLPFSMALYGRYNGQTIPTVCYFANFIGMSVGLNLHWLVARREGLLIAPRHEADLVLLTRRIRRLLVASVIGLGVAIFQPLFAILAFTAILLVLRSRDRLRPAA
ncbi:MAG TPA: TMEM175 family protein [Lacunisphaera sp.]|nr:TMEM175 family protein [Lacunisphaera sp.]